MFEAYWETARTNYLDWLIWILGAGLVVAHMYALVRRFEGRQVLFVQELDRYRTFCLLLTELLPMLGLLGTVLSLMFTFMTFQVRAASESPDLSQMVQAFAPAMSTTISGLAASIPNLFLNAILWLVSPAAERGHGQS